MYGSISKRIWNICSRLETRWEMVKRRLRGSTGHCGRLDEFLVDLTGLKGKKSMTWTENGASVRAIMEKGKGTIGRL